MGHISCLEEDEDVDVVVCGTAAYDRAARPRAYDVETDGLGNTQTARRVLPSAMMWLTTDVCAVEVEPGTRVAETGHNL